MAGRMTAPLPSSANTDNPASDHHGAAPAHADCLSGRLLDREAAKIVSDSPSDRDMAASTCAKAGTAGMVRESDRCACQLRGVPLVPEHAGAARGAEFRQAACDDRGMDRDDGKGSRADHSKKHNHDRYRSFRVRAGRLPARSGAEFASAGPGGRALRLQRAPGVPDQTHRLRRRERSCAHARATSAVARPKILRPSCSAMIATVAVRVSSSRCFTRPENSIRPPVAPTWTGLVRRTL